MGLKLIKPEERITFLLEFTKELLKNSKGVDKDKIKVEKLKQRFIEPLESPEKAFKKIIRTSFFEPDLTNKTNEPMNQQKYQKSRIITQTKNPPFPENPKRMQPNPHHMHPTPPLPFQIPQPRTLPNQNPTLPQHQQPTQITPQVKSKQSFFNKMIPRNTAPKQINPKQYFHLKESNIPAQMNKQPQQSIKTIQPVRNLRPEGFNLGKIELLLKDPMIESIECPGPGKKILVKKFGRINLTQITLSKEEVEEILKKFSEESKIPIMGGILKAAVGDLLISAVISKYVGSRFIITRIKN